MKGTGRKGGCEGKRETRRLGKGRLGKVREGKVESEREGKEGREVVKEGGAGMW